MPILRMIRSFVVAFFRDRVELATENLALRQQLAILQRTARRPRLRLRDRVFWVWLSKLWRDWRSALLVVKPDTVASWHRGVAERVRHHTGGHHPAARSSSARPTRRTAPARRPDGRG